MSAKPEVIPTPESIAKHVKQNLRAMQKSASMRNMTRQKGGQEVVREDDYRGHHIVIRTTYRITVDGKKILGHIVLTNAGQVQYHGLPNYTFDSAVGLVRALIDNFPEDFEKRPAQHGAHVARKGSRQKASTKIPQGLQIGKPKSSKVRRAR